MLIKSLKTYFHLTWSLEDSTLDAIKSIAYLKTSIGGISKVTNVWECCTTKFNQGHVLKGQNTFEKLGKMFYWSQGQEGHPSPV